MPIYEFDCPECGEQFESLVFGFSTDHITCPECDSPNVKKKISLFASKSSSTSASGLSTSAAACSTSST
ncbi:MAG: zinc ribbon domain-containing protein [Chloroflexi bacterium]|nr:zinc ribbon domain-containing protein [Chloroflexota bacterium]MBU1660143.1 zinc ribbon domain-containing protein [Chloroflexota bacterium]